MITLKKLNMIFIKKFYFAVFLSGCISITPIMCQVPTAQDCLGAIPICQNIYNNTVSYIGSGNYNDIPWADCLALGGETNSVWYTFTTQTSGYFSFILTPFSSADDYDWAVFNLTNASCSNLYSNFSSLLVSCNASGNTGETGISSAMGGVGNSNGWNNTPKFNADLPVQAGQTYVIMISNWSNGNPAYTINFSGSTAQIFDNVPPELENIVSNPQCGATSVQFTFSENILCNTISACDFTLTGPGGPYTVNNVIGNTCSAGGSQEKTFTVHFSPPATAGGTYSINLVPSICNSVSDLCGNIATSSSLSFNISAPTITVSSTPSTCTAADGTATVVASGGTGSYTYQWSTNPPQNTQHVTNLVPGTYYITVTSGNCSSIDSVTIPMNTPITLDIINITDETCGMGNGSATAVAFGGNPPLSFFWNTSPTQSNPIAMHLSEGSYSVTVSDSEGCTSSATVQIQGLVAPAIDAGIDVSICPNESIQLNAAGGYLYSWYPSMGLSDTTIANPIASPSITTAYVVTSSLPSGNIISNGDFSQGNSGFSSEYIYQSDLFPEGVYFVGQSPQTYHPGFVACTDHTNGLGNMMIVNGSGTPNTEVWCQVVNVIPNTDYVFSTWATTVSSSGSPAILQFSINGLLLGSSFNVGLTPCFWDEFYATWNSGNSTTASICIVNQNTVLGGNDFALDDIYFSPLCSTSDTVVVTVNSPPPVAVFAEPSAICNGDEAILTAQGADSYIWNQNLFGNGPHTVSPTNTTIYTVTGTDSFNCTATAQIEVQVIPDFVVSISPSAPVICEGDTITLTASTTANTPTFIWSNGLGQNANISISPITSTTYTVTVSEFSACSASSIVTVTVNPKPNVDFEGQPQNGCLPLTVEFSDESGEVDITDWTWFFGDGSISGIQNPVHTYNAEGQYDVQLTLTNQYGCTDTQNLLAYIEAYPQPIADFYTIPEIGKTYDPTITFYSSSISQSWLWDFGDGNTSISPPPVVHTYPDTESTYEVTLLLSNQYGCSDTLKKEVLIINDILVFPNVITPNGDGLNDKFEITNAEFYSENKLQVFNRWGKLVYETVNYQNNWDGGNLSDGTYYYIFYYSDKYYKSSLTIVRQ